MRIAIILYGQNRKYEIANTSFIKSVLSQFKNDEIYTFGMLWQQDSTTIEDLISVYPNMSVIEKTQKPFKEIKEYFSNKKTQVHDNFVSQLYSLHEGYKMLSHDIEKNGEYDLYIKTRTDLKFNGEIEFPTDKKSLYIRRDNFLSKYYISDSFSFTRNKNTLEAICNMGFSLDEMIDSIENNPTLYPYGFHHESISGCFCHKREINTAYFNMDWDLAKHCV